jgi:predicted transcriptional regulator
MKHEAIDGSMKQNKKRNSLKVFESDGLNQPSDSSGEDVIEKAMYQSIENNIAPSPL